MHTSSTAQLRLTSHAIMASAASLASSDTAGEEIRTGSAGALRPTGRTPPRRPVPVLTEAELEAYELNIDGGGKLTSGVHAIQVIPLVGGSSGTSSMFSETYQSCALWDTVAIVMKEKACSA